MNRKHGVIVSVTTAGPPAVVVVTIDGTNVPGVLCVRGYTPSAGHDVNVLVDGSFLLVLG